MRFPKIRPRPPITAQITQQLRGNNCQLTLWQDGLCRFIMEGKRVRIKRKRVPQARIVWDLFRVPTLYIYSTHNACKFVMTGEKRADRNT